MRLAADTLNDGKVTILNDSYVGNNGAKGTLDIYNGQFLTLLASMPVTEQAVPQPSPSMAVSFQTGISSRRIASPAPHAWICSVASSPAREP